MKKRVLTAAQAAVLAGCVAAPMQTPSSSNPSGAALRTLGGCTPPDARNAMRWATELSEKKHQVREVVAVSRNGVVECSTFERGSSEMGKR